MIRDEVQVERVRSLSEYAEPVPSDHADWAGMTSHTRLELQNEFVFEECGIAAVGEKYDHNYQAITSARIGDFERMQDDVGWFNEDDERNNEGIVADTDDGREKYTIEGRIRALLHSLLTDGRRHGNPTKENVTVEYTKHDSLDEYVVLIKWS